MLKDFKIASAAFLIKQLPSRTVFIDKKYKVVYASDKWINTYTELPMDLHGKGLFGLFKNLDSKWKLVFEDCFLGKSNPLGLQRYNTAESGEKWHEWSCVPWYNEDENILGAIIHVNDVTEVITSEIELEKKEILLKQQSEISKMGRWEYDIVQEKLLWCNMTKTIHEVPLNYVPDIHKAIDFYKEGHSKNTISMAIYEAMEKGKSWRHKLQIVTANGIEKWVLAAGMPIYENRKLVRLIGIFQDVDEQVSAHMQVRKNEKLLRTLVDNLPVNVYLKDLDHRKILVNKAECTYHNAINEQELLGKNNYDLYDAETAEKFTNQDIQVLSNLKPILGEEVLSFKKDGTETVFLTSKLPLINEMGEAYGILGISFDITQMKQKERELRNLIHVTASQNKKLLNFAHIVSHNLRSHSANFSMLLDFLATEKDQVEKEKIMGMLIQSSDSLMETLANLNEVLDITSKVSMGRKKINLSEKINAAKNNLKSLMEEHQVQLIDEVGQDIFVKGIPEYVENILANFLSNAIKYRHPQRKPVITLSCTQKRKIVVLSITDNGLGIDLDKYENKLFGMYKTFHKNANAKGMGLYITKNQIEAMNGRVTVESTVGKGTCFTVYLDAND
jgi:PAS domain S-box-containing protein